MLDSFAKHNKSVIDTILSLVYYFRRAISYQEAMALSPTERDLAISFVNKKIKEGGEMMKAGMAHRL